MPLLQANPPQKHDPDAPRGEYRPKEKPSRTSAPAPGNMNEKKKKKPDWRQLGTVSARTENRTKARKKKRGKSNGEKSPRSVPPSDLGRIFMKS